MIKELKSISKDTRISNPWWDYCFDKYYLPNGRIGEYHYIHTNGSTLIIPLLNKDTFILTKQYRYLNSKTSIEFPGGGIHKGNTPIENALCELKEETGFSSNNLELIGCFNPFNGVTDEICSVFVANDLFSVDSQPDESEEFEILQLSANDIIQNIKNGNIWDGMTLVAWSLFFFNNKYGVQL